MRWGREWGRKTPWERNWWDRVEDVLGIRQGAHEPAGYSVGAGSWEPPPKVVVILEGCDPRLKTGLWENTGAGVSPLRAFGGQFEPHGHLCSDSGEGGSVFHKAFQMFALLVCFIYLFILSGNNREVQGKGTKLQLKGRSP